jgi:hypothetical protein
MKAGMYGVRIFKATQVYGVYMGADRFVLEPDDHRLQPGMPGKQESDCCGETSNGFEKGILKSSIQWSWSNE